MPLWGDPKINWACWKQARGTQCGARDRHLCRRLRFPLQGFWQARATGNRPSLPQNICRVRAAKHLSSTTSEVILGICLSKPPHQQLFNKQSSETMSARKQLALLWK
jgi:hypothetical protein